MRVAPGGGWLLLLPSGTAQRKLVVEIELDLGKRTVRIRDNGTGIRAADFETRMTSFGASAKRSTNARGFRGVGRLSGLGYCQEPAAFSPSIELLDSNGKARLYEQLDGSENPVLAMADSNGANRLLLGHWKAQDVVGEADRWDKWSLVFRDPVYGWRNYVDIGVTTPLGTYTRTGYVVLYNNRDYKFSMEPKSK
jgi:hypothetical protein